MRERQAGGAGGGAGRRVVSERRLAANRRNALKSTGPRTPAGKARSAMNGLRHGAFAAGPVLPGEDPRGYVEHLAAVAMDLRPADERHR